MDPIIETTNLTKFYGSQRGIESLSLTVGQGEICGFVGPNGAGKTTTIRLILGFLNPTSGSVKLFGEPSGPGSTHHRARIGYLPGEPGLPEEMTGDSALKFYSDLSGNRAALREWLCDRLDLGGDTLRRRIATYSKGTKQKLGIVQALQHDPDLAILDEPTSGLDPHMQQAFFGILQELKSRGRTIFFSTHILPEVRILCDRACVVRDGKLVLDRSLAGLESSARRKLRIRMSDAPAIADADASQPDAPQVPPARFLQKEPDGWFVYEADAKDSPEILANLAALRPADFRFEVELDEVLLDPATHPSSTAPDTDQSASAGDDSVSGSDT